MLWCWRCKMEVAMLDEDEFAVVNRRYSQCMIGVKTYRKRTGACLSETLIDELFKPVRDECAMMTGMEDCHQHAIMHRAISIYGPPCDYCGKPLRTPQAAFCASCGRVREAHTVR